MKKLLIYTSLFLTFTTSVFGIYIPHSKQKVDNSISDSTVTQYLHPQNIWITRVVPPTQEITLDSAYWYSILHYYMITRLGYADIPFTYVVDREGNVYEGKSGKVGAVPEVLSEEGGILIGYLSATPDYTQNAQLQIQKLIEDNSFKYGIKKEDVIAVALSAKQATGQPTKSNISKDTSQFSSNTAFLANNLKYYSKENISYTGSVTVGEYTKSVKSGDNLAINVTLENKDDFAWFTDKEYIYITTSNFKDSPYAINGVWESFSAPLSIEDKTILPGQKETLTFNLKTLVLPGKYKASFQFAKLPNNTIKNTKFDIEFTVTKGDVKLVQVKPSPNGYLNVRDCPGPSCQPFGKINDGQVLIMEEKANGWYKIKYDEKKSGWVYGPYIKEI